MRDIVEEILSLLHVLPFWVSANGFYTIFFVICANSLVLFGIMLDFSYLCSQINDR